MSDEQQAPGRIWVSEIVALSKHKTDWHAHVSDDKIDDGDIEYVRADLAPVAQPPEHEGRIRRHEMTPERWEELQAALDRPTGPTDEEAEEVLQACGTSGKEVVNGFIERLLRENLELKRKLGSASLLPPSQQSEEIAKEIIQQLAPEANIHEGPHDFSLELWVDPLIEAIASALTAAQQRGSELQREKDAQLVEEYHEYPSTNDYAIATAIRANKQQ